MNTTIKVPMFGGKVPLPLDIVLTNGTITATNGTITATNGVFQNITVSNGISIPSVGEGNIFAGTNSGAAYENLTVAQKSGLRHCVAYGDLTMQLATSGTGNSAFGYHALNKLTTGGGNTAIGDANLMNTTTGGSNCTVGYETMMYNTVGGGNIAIGDSALYANYYSDQNIAIGHRSLYNSNNFIIAKQQTMTVGNYTIEKNPNKTKSYCGNQSNMKIKAVVTPGGTPSSWGYLVISGFSNTSDRVSEILTLSNNNSTNITTNSYRSVDVIYGSSYASGGTTNYIYVAFSSESNPNISIGGFSQYNNQKGIGNLSLGHYSLYYNTNGTNNIAIGYQSMQGQYGSNTDEYPCDGNISIGYQSMYSSKNSCTSNIAIGYRSQYGNNDSSNNIGIGYATLQNNTSGANNIALGYKSGYNLANGSYNIIIGNNIDVAANGGNSQLNIGNLIFGTSIYSGGSMSSTPVTNGRVGIGTSTPQGILDLSTTSLAFIPPRMTTGDKNTITTEGSVVYDTLTKKLCVRTDSTWIDL